MLFSIITPVLNGAPFLSAAIASIGAQTHGAFEHLIVDGGSEDGSLEAARAAAEADPRVRVFHRPGLGLYPSIAFGLDTARGDVAAWLNADDLYTPWAFAAVADFLARRPETDWLTGLPGCWDARGTLRFLRADAWRPRSLIRAGWCHKDLLGFLQQESILFRPALFRGLTPDERTAFEDARLAGDFILWRAFARHAPLAILPTALGGFRRHGANRSILGMDAYMAEARAAGATRLPSPIAVLARRAVSALAAVQAARAARRADDPARRPAERAD